MKTIDEQIECAKALLASLEEEKARQEAQMSKAWKPKAWKPKEGNDYYAILSDGEINSCSWYADDVDVGRYSLGNVYKTRKEAEFELECRKVETELRRYIYEHGGGDGEFVVNSSNYCIFYNNRLHEIEVVGTQVQTADIYCDSIEVLRDAIKAIGEDRIKKYYLRVKE